MRDGRAGKIEGIEVSVKNCFYVIGIVDLLFPDNFIDQGGHRQILILEQRPGNLLDYLRRKQRLISLDVHHDIVICHTQDLYSLGESVCPRHMIVASHHNLATKRLDTLGNTLVVGGYRHP